MSIPWLTPLHCNVSWYADADEPLLHSRLIRAIRDSDMTVGGRTALDREFDRTIEEELNEMDDPLNNGIKSRKNGARARQRRVSPFVTQVTSCGQDR